jgi:hypothetical protein
MNLQERLESLKSDIESAQERKNRLEGERDALLKRLEKEFECKSLKEAETLLETMREKQEKTMSKILEEVEALEEEAQA